VKILVAGGSGLIGAHITQVLRSRGHTVTTVARTPGRGVDHSLDLHTATPSELRAVLSGHDGLVFALRTEEQRPLPEPIYPAFRRAMVDPVVRVLTAARDEGLTRGLLLGSYYTYFDRLHPEWQLPARHTYIRCRVEQATEGRAAAGPSLPVAILELPFVLGRTDDRLPNWIGPFPSWARSSFPLFAPPGGTAVASAGTVALAAADALELASGEDLPIADENLTWQEMIARIAAAAGRPRPVRRLPGSVVRAALRSGGLLQTLIHRDTGLSMNHMADLFLAELFIEPASGRPLADSFRETFSEPAGPRR
jgi:nucleoside-diphosphate-sugar epimerase